MSAKNSWSGFLFGVGLAAFLDEVIFHQVLHWHHFYDQATTDIGLISDGLFHAFSWFLTIGGLFLFADLRRRETLQIKKWWGGVFFGLGAFQLYDGTIQHKVMKIHQIRYNVDVIPYDIVWNLIAIGFLMVGWQLMKRKSNERNAL